MTTNNRRRLYKDKKMKHNFRDIVWPAVVVLLYFGLLVHGLAYFSSVICQREHFLEQEYRIKKIEEGLEMRKEYLFNHTHRYFDGRVN